MTNVQHPQDSSAPRAAIYTRVSTDDQAREGYSLTEQERRARELAEREGWTVVGTYSDPGISGATMERPGLTRLLAEIAAGLIDVVIVVALDRLSRDAGHLREILRIFDAAGVQVIASGQALDRATPEGRLQTGILAEFAEFERQKIKARTKSGIYGRARDGKPWGTPKYGYRIVRGEARWEQDPSEVPIVRRIFRERVEEGRGYNEISRRLNTDGMKGRNGGEWNATMIKRILLSRHVLGVEFPYAREWHTHKHPPGAIIDPDTFDAAVALAAMGEKYAPSRGGRKPSLHLFTNGLLRCSLCGAAMLPRSDGDRYVCRTRKFTRGADGCDMLPQPRERVDRAALCLFERSFLDLDATRQHVAADLCARQEEVEVQEARAAREAAEKEAHLSRVERDYLAEKLSAENFERLTAQLTSEHAAALAERDRLRDHIASLRDSARSLDAEADTLRRLADLRASVVTRVRDAEQTADVAALRAALAQAFPALYLMSDGKTIAIHPQSRSHGVPLPARDLSVSASGVPE